MARREKTIIRKQLEIGGIAVVGEHAMPWNTLLIRVTRSGGAHNGGVRCATDLRLLGECPAACSVQHRHARLHGLEVAIREKNATPLREAQPLRYGKHRGVKTVPFDLKLVQHRRVRAKGKQQYALVSTVCGGFWGDTGGKGCQEQAAGEEYGFHKKNAA